MMSHDAAQQLLARPNARIAIVHTRDDDDRSCSIVHYLEAEEITLERFADCEDGELFISITAEGEWRPAKGYAAHPLIIPTRYGVFGEHDGFIVEYRRPTDASKCVGGPFATEQEAKTFATHIGLLAKETAP